MTEGTRQSVSTCDYERESMINHISIGVSDIGKAKAFYDAALKPLGYTCLSESADSLGYGRDAAALWLLKAKLPAKESRPGLHVCFDADTRKSVDQFHKAALAAGGRDNGAPGIRADYGANYYAAFVVDPDGYRLESYCGAAV